MPLEISIAHTAGVVDWLPPFIPVKIPFGPPAGSTDKHNFHVRSGRYTRTRISGCKNPCAQRFIEDSTCALVHLSEAIVESVKDQDVESGVQMVITLISSGRQNS